MYEPIADRVTEKNLARLKKKLRHALRAFFTFVAPHLPPKKSGAGVATVARSTTH